MLVLSLLVLALLSQGVGSPWGARWEAFALDSLRNWRTPLADRLMETVTHLGDLPVLLALAGGLAAAGWPSRSSADRGALLLVVAGSGLGNLLLKAWFERPRPGPDFEPLLSEPWWSFPSGHAMMTLAFYGFLAGRLLERPGAGARALAGLLGLLVVLVGLSRVYLAVHYPADVLAGYAAGAPFLWAALALARSRGGRDPGQAGR